MSGSDGTLQLLDEKENQNRNELAQVEVVDLRAQLESSRNRERNLEHQLKMFSTFQAALQSNNIDLESIYNQVLYKDARIVELNNIIMEKERQIMDLQEMCREQSQVAQSKNMALQIEFDERNVKDASTETDFGMENTIKRTGGSGRKQRNESPGRAVPQFKLSGGSGSPPPIDPSEDLSSYTTETATYLVDDIDGDLNREWSPSPSSSSPSKQLRKYRKRVTFDLKPKKNSGTVGRPEGKLKREAISPDNRLQMDSDFAQTIIDLTTENDQLRKIIAEIERTPVQDQQLRIEQLEEEIDQVRRDGKNQVLRARAAAQARIKELEGRIIELQLNHAKETDLLSVTNENMKSGREWAINENARLIEQIASFKSKLNDLHGELDVSLETNASYRQKIDAEEKKYEALSSELKETRRTIQQLTDEKHIAHSEIERLKEAIFAQDEFVSLLEGDLIVYEAHIGILRDSLGASKKEDRQIIKSKAFAAKLNALEMEKQQFVKKNNDERLRIKALNVKIRCLEDERDELLSRLKYYEQKHGANLAFHSSSQPVLYDTEAHLSSTQQHVEQPISGRSSETPPTAEEQQNDHNQHLNELQHRLEWTQHHLEAIQAENFKLEQQVQQVTHEHGLLETTLQTFYEKIYTIASHVPSNEIQNVENYLAEIEGITRHMAEENSVLKSEKEGLLKDLDMARHAVSEMEHVGKDVLSLKAQMEQEKLILEENWRQVKHMLVEKEKELASAEDKHSEKTSQLQELEQQIIGLKEENDALLHRNEQMKKLVDEKEVGLKEILSQMENLRLTIQQLETSNTNEQNLNSLSEENDQLKQTIASLRANMEHYKVEAELSRSCLDDLRNSGASASYKTAPPKSEVDSRAYITAQEALHQSANVDAASLPSGSQISSTYTPQVLQSASTTYPTQTMPISSQNYQQYNQYYPNQTYANTFTTSSAPYQQSTSNDKYYSVFETNETENTTHYQEHLISSTHSFNQIDARAGQVGTPSSAFVPYNRVDSRARLDVTVDSSAKNDIQLAEEVLRLQKQKTDLENELDELKNGLNQVEIERSLQVAMNEQLRSQLHEMRSQIEFLEEQRQTATNDQVVDVVEIQILRETVETLRREKVILETRLEDLEQEINKETEETAHSTLHMVDSEFDLEHPSSHIEKRDADVQCDSYEEKLSFSKNLVDSYTQDEKYRADVNIQCDFSMTPPPSETALQHKEKKESTSSVDTRQLYETIEEEHRLLLTCVTESSKLEEHLTSNVGQLLVLNNELETAVDVLKAEIWSLNAQLRKQLNEREEILDKLTNVESSFSTLHTDNILLKTQLDENQRELIRVKEESERRLGELRQLQEHKVQIEHAYAQLSERFGALQLAYNELLTRYQTPKCDSATDPLVEGAVIDSIEQLQDDLRELTVSSASMREDLEKSTERIKELQSIIQNNLSTTRETLIQLKEEQIYCLRATVTATINEIKNHLLNSFSQIQDALLKEKPVLETQGMTRPTKQDPEKISRAIKLCEEICADIEKGSLESSSHPHKVEESSLEDLLFEIRGKWKEREQQLRNHTYMLEEEKQITQTLQQRLKEAENKIKQFEFMENSHHLQSTSDNPTAKLTVKQADNDALFRATAELAHTNVRLQNEIDELRERHLSTESDVENESVLSTSASVHLKRSSESGKTESLLKETLFSTSKLRLEVARRSSNEEESEKSHHADFKQDQDKQEPTETNEWNWSENEAEETEKVATGLEEGPFVKMNKEPENVEEYVDQFGEEANQEEEEWKWDSENEVEPQNEQLDTETNDNKHRVEPSKEPEEWKWDEDQNEEEGEEGEKEEEKEGEEEKEETDFQEDLPEQVVGEEWKWDSDHDSEPHSQEVPKQVTEITQKIDENTAAEDWDEKEEGENEDNTTAEDWNWDEKEEDEEEHDPTPMPEKHNKEVQPPRITTTQHESADWAWDDETRSDEDQDELNERPRRDTSNHSQASSNQQEWKWSESEEELNYKKEEEEIKQPEKEAILSKQKLPQKTEVPFKSEVEPILKQVHVEEKVQKSVPSKPEQSLTPSQETHATRSHDNRTPPYRAATPEDLVLTASKFRKRNAHK
uniref:A-kinase anchor protein 9 n=1 Tax=Acrobeloides nanus TaxID=290746 RepID=A0A914C6M9_9BILA